MLVPVRTGADTVARYDMRSRLLEIRAETWFLSGLILIGAVLRFGTLGSQSYWSDESITVHEMQLSFGAMLHAIRVGETTPPLYFSLAWVWAKLFGTGEAGLRSLSALLGTGLIAVAYLCGKELVSRRAGLLTAALTAVSPYMIWYSQEARSYMLFAVLSACSFLFCIRAWRAPSRRNVWIWAMFSALALATHFFAGFLVAPEALWLLYSVRSRVVLAACASLVVVQAALAPLAASDTTHPLGWINAFPLSTRIAQIPAQFGFSALYQSSLVNYALLGAGVLAALVGGLLLIGAERPERRGAIFAAAMAAVVVLVPIVLAELGRDYLVPRNLTAAWIPLAVLIGAACAAPRARAAGAVLAAGLIAGFVWAGVRIAGDSNYQRPDWRAVASALGTPLGPRAVVAYDSSFATEPLSIYLPGVPWTRPRARAVSVSEVDIVGNVWQRTATPLPVDTRLLSSTAVDGYLVERFALASSWHLKPAAIAARAEKLLGPAPPGAGVLLQLGAGHRPP